MSEKITRALAGRLARSKGAPVKGVLYAAIASDKLPLTSFAARAQARNQEVRDKLSRIMDRINAWEAQAGQQVVVEVRPQQTAIAVTAPAGLFAALEDEAAVAAMDVERGT